MIELLQDKLPEFEVVPISKKNVCDVWEMMKGNEYFYSRTQDHEVTRKECVDDITALPPGKGLEDKTYVGIYEGSELIAAVDLIAGYPDEKTEYLGLLILAVPKHGLGIGKKILDVITTSAKEKGFEYIELACHKTNEIGFAFWSKNGFEVIRTSERNIDGKVYTLLSMRKQI